MPTLLRRGVAAGHPGRELVWSCPAEAAVVTTEPVLLAARETLPCNQGRGRRRDLSHLTQLPPWSPWAGAPGSPQGLCAGPAATLVPPGPGCLSPAPDSPPPVPGQSQARAFCRGQGVGPERFTRGERVTLLLDTFTCVLNAGHRSGLGRGPAGRQPEASGACAFIPGMQDGQSWLRLEGVSQTHHLKRGSPSPGLVARLTTWTVAPLSLALPLALRSWDPTRPQEFRAGHGEWAAAGNRSLPGSGAHP